MVGEDSIRFFYKAPGVTGALLRVEISAESDRGESQSFMQLNGSARGWQVSPPMQIPNVRGEDGRQEIDITFEAIGRSATWFIDDVMVDPWRTR